MLPLALVLRPLLGWYGVIVAWVVARWIVSGVALTWLQRPLKRGVSKP